MKINLKVITLFGIILTSMNIHSLQGLNVLTITTDDPQGYVEWLTENQPVFQAVQGDNAAAQGICSPSAGGVYTNEHYVWTISPSISAMMSNPGFFSNESVVKAISEISDERKIIRRDLMYVVKETEVAPLGNTNAQYNLISSTNDVAGYAAALTSMEEAASENGFDDIKVALFGSLVGGDRALTVMASVQAPTSERLGEFFDQRQSAWMQESLSEFSGIRTPVIDFMMQCTTLSVNG